MNKLTVLFISSISLFLFLSSCQDEFDVQAQLDCQLDQALEGLAGNAGRNYFKLPGSDQFSAIPQDPRNLITQEKVTLGKLLYHETGLSLAPVKSISSGTYSCASCHQAAAGFQAGRPQCIRDGEEVLDLEENKEPNQVIISKAK